MSLLADLRGDPRITVRRDAPPDPNGRCVVYWMERSQRAIDNPALDIAVKIANRLRLSCVIFLAAPSGEGVGLRHSAFFQQGIEDIAETAAERNFGFVLRRSPENSVARFCEDVRAAMLIGDENPLREPRVLREKLARQLKIPFWTVDSNVVVPAKLLLKEQYAARIIRPRLRQHLPEFLKPCDNLCADVEWKPTRGLEQLDWRKQNISSGLKLDRTVTPVDTFQGGTREALRLLGEFVRSKLRKYPEHHNRADLDGTSRLSPYLRFGHIGPLTIALAVQKARAPQAAKDDFLDQLITWRELAVNFVRFNPLYDTFECGPEWAHRTLAAHARDPRPVLYSRRQLEAAETHDDLWNAAQAQMLRHGWMHNYLRMYWAKKILEWSPSPQQAYQIAAYLNDKYQLDGRDPNGYAGIAWSIVGKFDRPWFERPIFGTVRYMARSGAEKKFEVKEYILSNRS